MQIQSIKHAKDLQMHGRMRMRIKLAVATGADHIQTTGEDGQKMLINLADIPGIEEIRKEYFEELKTWPHKPGVGTANEFMKLQHFQKTGFVDPGAERAKIAGELEAATQARIQEIQEQAAKDHQAAVEQIMKDQAGQMEEFYKAIRAEIFTELGIEDPQQSAAQKAFKAKPAKKATSAKAGAKKKTGKGKDTTKAKKVAKNDSKRARGKK